MPAEQHLGSSKGGSAEVLELRGIMSTSDGPAYWITQKGKRSADWVMLNEKGHDFVVISVDSTGEAVEVDFFMAKRSGPDASFREGRGGGPIRPAQPVIGGLSAPGTTHWRRLMAATPPRKRCRPE